MMDSAADRLRGRSITSFSKVQRLVGSLVRDRRFQFRRVARGGKKLLNVGCGSNTVDGFINLDYAWRPGLDLCCDITHGIPLPSGSLSGIYTEHCLEHITFEQCLRVLRHFHRLLESGGGVRIAVPDGGLYLERYALWQSGQHDLGFPYVGLDGQRDLVEDSVIGFTPMMAVNRIFRGYGHRFCYDFQTLANMLRRTGFVQVERGAFRAGRLPDLLIDSELRAPQTLYVEAVKPRAEEACSDPPEGLAD